jgi:anti-sigma factor RsiW
MNCSELRSRLDAYARGSLTPAEAAAFEKHLDGCAACEAYLETGEPRLAEAERLAKSVEPAVDLWPEIRTRLRTRDRGGRGITVPRWALAAAAVLLIAVSSGVTAVLLRAPHAGPTVSTAEAVSPLEASYASASAELATALDRARGKLAPATIAIIERNLAVIDGALAESRRALAADPGNAALERLVIAAWQQKVDLLRRAAALSTEG